MPVADDLLIQYIFIITSEFITYEFVFRVPLARNEVSCQIVAVFLFFPVFHVSLLQIAPFSFSTFFIFSYEQKYRKEKCKQESSEATGIYFHRIVLMCFPEL